MNKILAFLIVAITLSSNLALAKYYSVTAGNWQVDFKSNETLYTSVEWKAPANSDGVGFYMVWVKKDPETTSRTSAIFLYDYSPNSVPTNRAWMEKYVSGLISGFNNTPSISEYFIDGRKALIAEGWSKEFEKFTYAVMYPFDPTTDNTAQKFVGFNSNLDKKTTSEILDSLHVEYAASSQIPQTLVTTTTNIEYAESPKATQTPVTAQAVGTRKNPVPIGMAVDLGDGWQIAVISVIPDATNAVLRENQFNDPPKTGNRFFLARVQAKYTGTNSATFNGGLRLRAVGPSSIGYSTFENSAGVIPDPLPDSEVFSGGVIEGNIGWEIKSSDANMLVMYDNPISFGASKDRMYMALYGPGSSTYSPSNLNDKNWGAVGAGKMGRPATWQYK